MTKILLFADVGGHEYQKYYHVGDEAMLYETYRWYKANHPSYRLTALTWFPSKKKLDLIQVPHLHWSEKHSYTYFPVLCLKLILWRITAYSFFSSPELALVQTISQQDRIHFTGGGNISSQFRQWMYYSFFVLIAAKLLGKEIILTSQTVGPVAGIDRIFAFFTLNLPKIIGIRARTSKLREFKKYGVFLPQVYSMLDAAYALPTTNFPRKVHGHKTTVIGLSLHAWKGWEEEGAMLVNKILTEISEKYLLRIVLIPHHLVEGEDGTDLVYMKGLVTSLPQKVQVDIPPISKLLVTESVPAAYIKKLTAQVDILLTTRYHGLIFGLSQNIPTIALHFDEYYRNKNIGALQLFFGAESCKYQVSVKDTNALEELSQKIRYFLQNHTKEIAGLKKINERVCTYENTLDKIPL